MVAGFSEAGRSLAELLGTSVAACGGGETDMATPRCSRDGSIETLVSNETPVRACGYWSIVMGARDAGGWREAHLFSEILVD